MFISGTFQVTAKRFPKWLPISDTPAMWEGAHFSHPAKAHYYLVFGFKALLWGLTFISKRLWFSFQGGLMMLSTWFWLICFLWESNQSNFLHFQYWTLFKLFNWKSLYILYSTGPLIEISSMNPLWLLYYFSHSSYYAPKQKLF